MPDWGSGEFRAGRYLVPGALLILSAGLYLQTPVNIPPADAQPFDNIWMGEHVAAIANGGLDAYLALKDPWLRYLPQVALAVLLPLGGVSIREAILINGYYVTFLQAVGVPAGSYFVASHLFSRRIGIITLAWFAGIRSAGTVFSEPFEIASAAVLQNLFYVRASNLFQWTVGVYLTEPVYYMLIPLLGTALLWLATVDLTRRIRYIGLYAVAVIVSLGWFHIDSLIFWIQTDGARSTHWYMAIAPPFFLGATYAVPRSLSGKLSWTVCAGVFVGIVGSIQLAHGLVAAGSIAAAYTLAENWRELAKVGLVAFLVSTPSILLAVLNSTRYLSGAQRIIVGGPFDFILAIGVASLVFGGLYAYPSDSLSKGAIVLAGVLIGGMTAAGAGALLFDYWSDYMPFLLRGALIIALAVGSLKLVRSTDRESNSFVWDRIQSEE